MASDTKTDKKPVSDARSRLAQVAEIATLVIAGMLVLGAILVAIRGSINADNPLVELVINIAETFDGPLSRMDGILQFTGKSAVTQNALANWGIAAAVWLVIGRIAGRLIRP